MLPTSKPTNGDSTTMTSAALDDVHMAARYGNADTVRHLIVDAGRLASERRGSIGSTPAHDAAVTGNLATLTWLLAETGDMADRAGATVAHVLARYGHTAGLEWLVTSSSSGVQTLTARTQRGATPLHYASTAGHLETIKLIITHLKRLAEETSSEEDASKGSECQCARCNLEKLVNLQIECGATAVYLACQEGHLDVARHLVTEAGVSLKLRTYDGMTCFHAAAQSGHIHILRWLMTTDLKSGINDRDFDGLTPLHYAAGRGHAHIVSWLISNGSRFTIDSMNGTALHMAAANGKLEVVRRLLSKGIDRDVIDNDTMTAAMLATVCQQEHCAQLINEWSSTRPLYDDDLDATTPSVTLTIPEIVHSDESDLSDDAATAGSRDVLTWPPPPPPLTNFSDAESDASDDVSSNGYTEPVSGEVQRLQVGYHVTRQRTVNETVQSHGSGASASSAAAAAASSIKPKIPVAPPLNLPTTDRKLVGDPTTGRTGSARPSYIPLQPFSPATNSSSLASSPISLSSIGGYGIRGKKFGEDNQQVRNYSKSSGDLIAELKAHFNGNSSGEGSEGQAGGIRSLRKVGARSPGSSMVFPASTRPGIQLR